MYIVKVTFREQLYDFFKDFETHLKKEGHEKHHETDEPDEQKPKVKFQALLVYTVLKCL